MRRRLRLERGAVAIPVEWATALAQGRAADGRFAVVISDLLMRSGARLRRKHRPAPALAGGPRDSDESIAPDSPTAQGRAASASTRCTRAGAPLSGRECRASGHGCPPTRRPSRLRFQRPPEEAVSGSRARVFVSGRSAVDRLTGPRRLDARRTPATDGRCLPSWPAAKARR